MSPPPRHPEWAGVLFDDDAFLICRLGARATKLFAEALEPLGLRPRHYAVLNFLGAQEGTSQQQVGQGLWIDPSTMVALIDDFEQRGLAVRRPNAGDRRRYAVHLTDAGREVLERARSISREVEARLLAPLSDAEREHLHGALVAMAEAEAIPIADPVRQTAAS